MATNFNFFMVNFCAATIQEYMAVFVSKALQISTANYDATTVRAGSSAYNLSVQLSTISHGNKL